MRKHRERHRVEVAPKVKKRVKGETRGDSIFRAGTALVALGVLALIGLIVVVLSWSSRVAIGNYGVGFISGGLWDPVAGSFGAAPFIYGTLVTSALALLLGVPISLGIAIFLSELAPRWLRSPLSFLVELLAAVPSVIYGLWGIFVLVPVMRNSVEPSLKSVLGFLPIFQGTPVGVDMLTAGVILAIMIIPTVSAVSREALMAVPQSQREAALSLGATHWESTRIAVIKYARSGIFGAFILGLGRAVGETMAVTMTIGNRNVISGSLFSQGQTIASMIASDFTEAGPLELSALIYLGLVLMFISLLINVVARLVVGRLLKIGEAVE